MARSQITTASTSWVQVILLPQPPQELRLQVHHHTLLICNFLVETRSLSQAGFELLSSSDPPALALASQSSGITGVSHHAWPVNNIGNVALISHLNRAEGTNRHE